MLKINFIKNKIANFSDRLSDIKKNISFKEKKQKLKKINMTLISESFWKKNNIYSLKQEKLNLIKIIKEIENIQINIKDVIFYIKFLELEKDEKIFSEIFISLDSIEFKLKQLELRSVFTNVNDSSNCYLDIQAGSGGIDAQDWSKMLLRMYLKWSESHNFKTEIIEESEGEIAGIKSATVKIIGDFAYGWLRTENGIHRLVRKSPFDSGRRRHTSFSSTFIYPEVKDDSLIKINQSDLRIDVYRSSGPGGQHVNRTESAVRVTHLPTGIVTKCQNHRSQHKNKEQAIKQLKAKLYKLKKEKKQEKQKILEQDKLDIRWGNQIRSYILDNPRIKDLRTGIETSNVQYILDGNLDFFIKKTLKIQK